MLLKHIWKSVQSSEDKIPLMQISATIRVVKILGETSVTLNRVHWDDDLLILASTR